MAVLNDLDVFLVRNTSILLAVLVLLMSAWVKWMEQARVETRLWRNRIGGVALVTMSGSWVITVLGYYVQPYHGLYSLARPLALGAAVLAIALGRSARLQAVLAGLLIFSFWSLGYW
jgi:hypothetical protein